MAGLALGGAAVTEGWVGFLSLHHFARRSLRIVQIGADSDPARGAGPAMTSQVLNVRH